MILVPTDILFFGFVIIFVVVAAAHAHSEYTYCSSRGTCDFNTGLCKCYPGFGNTNCDRMEQDVHSTTSNDALMVFGRGPYFDGAVLHVIGQSQHQDGCVLLLLENAAGIVAVVDDTGITRFYQNKVIIDAGGLEINADGASIVGNV